MKIYVDVISGDEVFSDSYDPKIQDDVVFVVETKNIVVTEDSYVDVNPEDDEEGGAGQPLDNASATVVNLEYAYHLSPTAFDKSSYMAYLKTYMSAIKAHLEKTCPERVSAFQKGAQTFAKKVLSNFSDYEFYTTESMDPNGIVLLKWWRDNSTTPTFFIWKDGLEEVRV